MSTFVCLDLATRERQRLLNIDVRAKENGFGIREYAESFRANTLAPDPDRERPPHVRPWHTPDDLAPAARHVRKLGVTGRAGKVLGIRSRRRARYDP